MGIVHNAVYLQYFEQARLMFFKELIGANWNWSTHGVIVVRNEVDYLQPILLTNELFVEIFCISIGNSSYTLGYKLLTKNGNDFILHAKGKTVLVCFNHQLKAKTAIYDEWKGFLNTHLSQF